MRILIADDDLTSRIVLTSVLEKCGHDIVEDSDGTEAWVALQQSDSPRLAILDWMMPGREDPEVCRHARAHQTSQPPYVILLTTRGAKKDVAEGLCAGADDYLAKPFDPAEPGARVEVGCRMIALQDRLASNIRELREDLAHIKTLQGILPICAGCKKIRDDKGFLSQVEACVSAHSEATFSHALCLECMPKYFSGFIDENVTHAKKDTP